MWDLISIAQDHACVESHDKVYALLGVFGPLTQATIWPSYETWCSRVFKEMFLGHSRLTGRLDLLSYCAPDEKSISPTWAPNWVSRGSGMFVHSSTQSQAAGLSKAYLQNNEMDELEATGLLVAKISTLFAELPVSCVRSAAAPQLGFVRWLQRLELRIHIRLGKRCTQCC